MASWTQFWNRLLNRARPPIPIDDFSVANRESNPVGQDPYIYSAEVGGELPWAGFFAIRLRTLPVERESKEDIASKRSFEQQVDVINALYSPYPPRAFALRYIAWPNPFSLSASQIEIAILGKVGARRKDEARVQAQELCFEVMSLLGGMMPDYGWEVVTEGATFSRLWTPFEWPRAHVVEIRRREDRVRLETVRPRPALGRDRDRAPSAWTSDETVYYVHPFGPRPTGLTRFLRTLLLQPAPIMLQTTISPVELTEEEEEAWGEEIAKCERYEQRREALVRESVVSGQTIHEARAKALCEGLLRQLLRLQDAPFLLNIALASPAPLSRTVAEAAGVEITAPVGSGGDSGSLMGLQVGGYDVVVPHTEDEKELSRKNVSIFAFKLWGRTLAPPPLERARYLADAYEAAAAFRFPIATDAAIPGLEVKAARFRPLPREVAVLNQGPEGPNLLRIGENCYLGARDPVVLSEASRRQHLYIVGQTGTGKTTLLKTMIVGDMAAGKGLAVIDPHGDLFDELLGHLPADRIDDVVILDPTDMEFPVGLNLFQCAPDQRHFVVREMRSIVERLLVDQYRQAAVDVAGPIFYWHMQNNMLLVMSREQDPGTLLEFYELYQHKHYWLKWIPLGWQEPMLQRWARSLTEVDYTSRNAEGVTLGDYLSSKFVDFILDPKLRLIFGQKRSTINLRQIMDEGKILLVNLAKGELAEANARFLGMVLMAKILATAMERVHLRPEKRRTFCLYVDEFQSLATQSFILLLSEARKFGLSLVLANQFVSQIHDEQIVQSIFGNVGTLVSFRVGQEDALKLAPHFAPAFDEFDLTNLPNWHACVKTTVDGQVVTPFTLRTVLLSQPVSREVAEQARMRSRQKYGRPREEVEKEIVESLTFTPDLGKLELLKRKA